MFIDSSEFGGPMRKKSLNFYKRICLIGLLLIFAQILIFYHYIPRHRQSMVLSQPYFDLSLYPLNVNLMAILQSVMNREKLSTKPLYNKFVYYYVENAARCFPQNVQYNLTIVIKSDIHRMDRRDTIRQTWADEYCWKPWRIRLLFFVNESDNLTMMASIYSEFIENADIVQFTDDVITNSSTSSYTAFVAFQWLRNNCLNSDFVLFVDENIDFNPTLFMTYLKSNLSPSNNLYVGKFISPQSIIRRNNGSSFSDSSIDKWELYSPYLDTNFLLLSSNIVKSMAIGMQFIKYCSIEEIYLAIVAGKLNITITELPSQFQYFNSNELLANKNGSSVMAPGECQGPIVQIPDLPVNASKFPYPLNIDMKMLFNALEEKKRVNRKPINPSDFLFSIRNDDKCKPFDKPIDLLLVIKDRTDDFDLRMVIRQTWGNESCWDKWVVRRLFALGTHRSHDVNQKIGIEAKQYNDIIRQNFQDTYHNNTYKTMMSLNWVTKNCPNAKFILFVDSDVYLNAINIKNYLLKLPESKQSNLYGGLYLPGSKIYRNKRSKWFVSEEEIRWPKYPPFIMGGVLFLSYNNIRKMATIMPYMRYFKIDDAFMGIMAHKLGIKTSAIPNIHLVSVKTMSKSFLATHFYNAKKTKDSWNTMEGWKYCQ